MYTMDQVHRIRELYFEQGKNLAEVAEIVHCDWRTVRKYIDKDDFSPHPPDPKENKCHGSKLDKYKAVIDSWLESDKKAPRKQRHTAKRIYNRLKAENPDFNVCYRLVAQYVSDRKHVLYPNMNAGYIPLIHSPGEAQADFGTADFFENGMQHQNAKYFVLSFPYSNGGYLQLHYGENLECLLESLQSIFRYIGGVPTEIWFDNTSTLVTEILKDGGRELNERFLCFAEHYRFKPVFMNPDAGNEKGNVENKVGYLRRNELVPVPHFENLNLKNESLLRDCDKDMVREHYKKGSPIFELFQEDVKALLPLPGHLFDTAKYLSVRTDKYGKFKIENGLHEYSASPAMSSGTVQLKLTSDLVIVMDENMHEIVRHKRLYGKYAQASMEWLPYLKYIARKPRSLRNSGIYEMLPETVRQYMDKCANSERGQVLKVLSELTDRSGFASAVDTVNHAIIYNATDPDSLQSLYRRLYNNIPELPPLPNADNLLPENKIIAFHYDMSMLDSALRGAGVDNG